MFGVDLHTHSFISDGTLSPEQLVQAALDLKIHTLALTDHDTMDGVARATDYAQPHDIKIISGVEVSSQWSRPSTKKFSTYSKSCLCDNQLLLLECLSPLTIHVHFFH